MNENPADASDQNVNDLQESSRSHEETLSDDLSDLDKTIQPQTPVGRKLKSWNVELYMCSQ